MVHPFSHNISKVSRVWTRLLLYTHMNSCESTRFSLVPYQPRARTGKHSTAASMGILARCTYSCFCVHDYLCMLFHLETQECVSSSQLRGIKGKVCGALWCSLFHSVSDTPIVCFPVVQSVQQRRDIQNSDSMRCMVLT